MSTNNKTLPINAKLLAELGVSRPTLIYWCRNYTVDGRPIGVKVGGRWRIFKDRIDRLKEVGIDDVA